MKYYNQSESSAPAVHDLLVHFYHIQCTAYLDRYACFCDRNSLHCDSAVVVRTVFWQAANMSLRRQSVSRPDGLGQKERRDESEGAGARLLPTLPGKVHDFSPRRPVILLEFIMTLRCSQYHSR